VRSRIPARAGTRAQPGTRVREGEAPSTGIPARRIRAARSLRRHRTGRQSHGPAAARAATGPARIRYVRVTSAHAPAARTPRRSARPTPASACRRSQAPALSPGRRTDCAGSFTTLPGRYRTQSRRRLPTTELASNRKGAKATQRTATCFNPVIPPLTTKARRHEENRETNAGGHAWLSASVGAMFRNYRVAVLVRTRRAAFSPASAPPASARW
jgi:hypothetical protein